MIRNFILVIFGLIKRRYFFISAIVCTLYVRLKFNANAWDLFIAEMSDHKEGNARHISVQVSVFYCK